MKRQVWLLACVCWISSTSIAQSFINKVPANASAVIKYSGETFSQKLPLQKLDGYEFIRKTLFKATGIDTLTSLQHLGVNFEQDTYQYVATDDSTINFVTLFSLKDEMQFLALLQANYHAEMKPEQKNGYQQLTLAPNTYVGWNQQQAVLVVSTYKSKTSYYSTMVTSDNTLALDTVAVIVDTAVAVVPPPKAEIKHPGKMPAGKGKATGKGGSKKGTQKKSAANSKNGGTKKKGTKKQAPAEETIVEEITEYKMSAEDSAAEAKRQAWYEEQDRIAAARQKQAADSVISYSFATAAIANISSTESYRKLVEPAANVSVWLDYENLLQQYWATYFGKIIGAFGKPFSSTSSNEPGTHSGMNFYFENNRLRIAQKMWSPDKKMDDLNMKVYSSKQAAAMTNYINPDNLGYLSMSINTEAMAGYYYAMLRRYMKNAPYVGEYADLVDVYIDVLDIVIDEKAIAEVMPGNSLFVMHEMTTKDVTYTDFVYNDSDFTSKEVIKTKKELSPNFTFVMETKRDDFMQKLANLPVKYAEKGKYDYKEKGGYYELAFDKNRYPISSLYFMVKNGKVIVTTNKASIDMTLNNTSYPADAAIRTSVLNNNFSMKLNSKKIIEQVSAELSTDASKKVADYLAANMGDVTMEAGIKDGMMQGTTIMAITGNHTNSLEFFFNMMSSINEIIEKDKQEKDKIIN